MDENEIVQVKLDQRGSGQKLPASKAFQIRIGDQKNVIVYNHIQSYILDALLKAVMINAH
uniref:hypothetical protein n=1 Tax=Lentilactobacillus hilgardii TaxID=1588 RepID=UPI00403F102A